MPPPLEVETFILLVARLLCDFFVRSGKTCFVGSSIYQSRPLKKSRK